VTPWEHVVEQVSAKKPLGMLQRGSGAGALWAAATAARKAHPIVLQAMSWDARWDRVMENRALYFGGLATDLRLDLEPLFRHIRENDRGFDFGERFGRVTGLIRISPVIELPIAIVSVLMARGNDQAREFARRYVAEGLFWRELLEDAARRGGVGNVAGMDNILAGRFPAIERTDALKGCDPRREPWKSWTAEGASELTSSLKAKAHDQEKHLGEARAKQDQKTQSYASKSTEELLALANGEYLEALAQRGSEGDVAVMLGAIRPENGKKAAAAIRALGEQLDPRMIEPTVRTVEGNSEENLIHIQAAPFLSRFPAELVLPVARKWLASGNGAVWHCTRGILWNYATSEDIPLVVPILRKRITPQNVHVTCDALRIASRFKGHGPFKEVRRLFKEIPSSWGRSFAAKALAATEPNFPETYAYDCLWDCESDTRATGTAAVPLNDRRARERLRSLASDSLESEETRQAAADRLGKPD
jgi:hypothetical protein